MEVDVFDALEGLAGQPRCVEIVDVGDLGVEETERLEHGAPCSTRESRARSEPPYIAR